MDKQTEILSGQGASEALEAGGGKYELALVHNMVGGFAERIRDRTRKVTGDRHYEGYDKDWQKECDEVQQDVDAMKAQENIFVVTENGKPVGMASVKKIGNDPNTGREVWEIIQVSVLEWAEGRSHSARLITAAIEGVRQRNPFADVLIATSNDAIAHVCGRMGVPRIPIEHLYQIKHGTMDVTPFREEMEQARTHAKDYLLPAERKF